MEAVAVLVLGTLLLLAVVSPFLALAAIIRMSRLEKRLDAMNAWLSAIEKGGGLALRSRGLFYAAYGLFGVTAVKVVMIDLATMPTLYRMLSFLALGVLLLAGAWLNLRFRERLVAPGGGS